MGSRFDRSERTRQLGQVETSALWAAFEGVRGSTTVNKFCLSQLTGAPGIVTVHNHALIYQNGEGGFGDYIQARRINGQVIEALPPI